VAEVEDAAYNLMKYLKYKGNTVHFPACSVGEGRRNTSVGTHVGKAITSPTRVV